LELGELLKDFGFEMQQINTSEFTKIINETNIIFLSSKGARSWPHTPEKASSRGLEETLVDTGYGSW
jgi:hypothetical protein